MIPPLYGFAMVDIGNYEYIILGGKAENKKIKKSIYTYNFGFNEWDKSGEDYCT